MLGTEMLRTIIKVVFTSHLAKEEEDEGDQKVDVAREHTPMNIGDIKVVFTSHLAKKDK
jgi:hypothetical protein